MYFLGVSNPEAGTVGMPHSPDYVADDASILVGTRAMLAAMLARLMADQEQGRSTATVRCVGCGRVQRLQHALFRV
jgi:hypothetical protein